MVDDNLDAFIDRLDGVKRLKSGSYIAKCPAHEDSSPSLSVSLGSDGKVLVHCFVGCSVERIVQSLGMKMTDLWPESDSSLSPSERRLLDIEREQRRLAKRLEDHEKRITALEKINACTDYLQYHRNLFDHPESAEYWLRQGFTIDIIEKYQLGYCPSCRTDYPKYRPSYTIPVISNGKLWNIRHRLISTDGDRYRPHMAGLPTVLFNADYLRESDDEEILIVEGEKKSICAAQYEWDNVGIMGKQGFKDEWIPRFSRFKRVVVALDPDANTKALEIARKFGSRGYVAALPDKLDDMLNPYGSIRADPDDVWWFLKNARRAA